jgi:hypothetical protein
MDIQLDNARYRQQFQQINPTFATFDVSDEWLMPPQYLCDLRLRQAFSAALFCNRRNQYFLSL